MIRITESNLLKVKTNKLGLVRSIRRKQDKNLMVMLLPNHTLCVSSMMILKKVMAILTKKELSRVVQFAKLKLKRAKGL